MKDVPPHIAPQATQSLSDPCRCVGFRDIRTERLVRAPPSEQQVGALGRQCEGALIALCLGVVSAEQGKGASPFVQHGDGGSDRDRRGVVSASRDEWTMDQ